MRSPETKTRRRWLPVLQFGLLGWFALMAQMAVVLSLFGARLAGYATAWLVVSHVLASSWRGGYGQVGLLAIGVLAIPLVGLILAERQHESAIATVVGLLFLLALAVSLFAPEIRAATTRDA